MATSEEVKTFINTLGNLAIAESNRRIANGSKYVLPSICVGQSALETGYGTSSLMVKAKAFFGIKAGGSWTGKVYTADTQEVVSGETVNTVANFRAYDSLQDSVADYYDLIINNSRYSGGLSTYPGGIKTPYDTVNAIWSGGYATDETYVEKVMSIVNSNNLTDLDSKVDGTTFDPNYTWEGGTGGSSGGTGGSTPSTGHVSITYKFEKIENIKL